METQSIESFWLLTLASKCQSLSSQNTLLAVLLVFAAWTAVSLLHWAHPGGPAWGKHRATSRVQNGKIIPGPRGFPIVGSLSLMANLAHRKLASTASRFGANRLMAFSLGESRAIVTSSAEVAKEILTSSAFADRPVKEFAYGLMFNRSMGFAPYGRYWRTLRRVAATHLFSARQITASGGQRSRVAAKMVAAVGREAASGNAVAVKEILMKSSLLNMMGSVFGREYELDSADSESEELRRLVGEGYELLGKLNWSDHLSWIGCLDLQRIRFRCSKLVPQVNRLVSRIIQEHREASDCGPKDFVDVLLSLSESDKLSEPDMIAVLWEMIFRGTDTVAVLIEWILARMVLHPDIQSKVQEEIDRVVGKSRPLMESDIASTVYLQAVVKEVMRLHPPGPLLSWARLAITDTTIDGFHVPAGTTAMVNMWAITRDPNVWPDPLEFKPERFAPDASANEEFSIMGSDLRLAPFGSGPRVCPGKALGLTTVTFLVGTLLREFEWVGSGRDPVDLTEAMRLSSEMKNPLTVKVCRRQGQKVE